MKLFSKKIKLFLLLAFITSLLLFTALSCDTTEPKENMQVQLTELDASCTEAWLKLSAAAPVNPTVKIKTGDRIVFEGILTTSDTMIYVDSLSPSTDYTYKVELAANTNKVTTSTTIRTMDTTSHNFTWQTFTFGDAGAGSSYLNDVAIINENDIWAVGEIYMNDSLGNPDPNSYNAVHWDGTNWELKKVGGYGGWACRTVFAFSENDVWFDGTIKWDGANYSLHNNGFPLEPNGDGWQINKMWGGGSNNLYAVGNGGNIAHYNGKEWKKISSGTELDINDIYGAFNEEIGEWEILAVGGNILHGGESERVILKIKENQIQQLKAEGANWPLSSIWFKSNRKYYVVGSGGKFQKNNLNEEIWEPLNISSNYLLYRISGGEFNEIAAAGAFGELLYFNGIRWNSYLDEAGLNYGIFFSVIIKNNIIAAVGFDNQSAAITIGKRIN